MVHSNSAGAIGILGVKKSVDGVWLYFAHNTDTFVRFSAEIPCAQLMLELQAIASMGSDDSKPKSLMSRSKGDNRIITGGRSIKYWPRHSWGSSSPATWLSNPDQALNPPDLPKDERPKAKKPMFKHVPYSVDPKKQPLSDSEAVVEDALHPGSRHSRPGSEQEQPCVNWHPPHRDRSYHVDTGPLHGPPHFLPFGMNGI